MKSVQLLLVMGLVLALWLPALAEERTIESFPGQNDAQRLQAGLEWVFQKDARHLVAGKNRYILSEPVTVTVASGAAVVDFRHAQMFLKGHAHLSFSGRGEPVQDRIRFLRFKNLQVWTGGTDASVALRFAKTARLLIDDVNIMQAPAVGLELEGAWDATLRDVVLMTCGSATQPALEIKSEGRSLSNRVTLDNCTLERSKSLALRASRTANLIISGGSKIHGRSNWAYIGPLVELTDCSCTQVTATTISWADPGEQGIFVVKGRKSSSTLIDVLPQINVKGRMLLNKNTNSLTKIVVRVPAD